MEHPYQSLPPRSYWRSAMADVAPLQLQDVYRKRFEIPADARVATAGSCFAQHIGGRLRARGFNVLDMEPAPPAFPEALRARFGYGLFSARYGNIYSARQLHQLIREARGAFAPVDAVWECEGRFYDPYRPSIEPDGFASAREAGVLRAAHLEAVRAMFHACDVFIFTLGLTETWRSRIDGAVYPICPGTIAGRFDPERHVFVNAPFAEILEDMLGFIGIARQFNSAMRYVLTVSPQPLTATATGQHVLSATTYSKSVLRAVCGELCAHLDYVDYFPAYEIVTTPTMRGMLFADNLRTVTPEGVDHVMSHFFDQHVGPNRADPLPDTGALGTGERQNQRPLEDAGAECEEERLAGGR